MSHYQYATHPVEWHNHVICRGLHAYQQQCSNEASLVVSEDQIDYTVDQSTCVHCAPAGSASSTEYASPGKIVSEYSSQFGSVTEQVTEQVQPSIAWGASRHQTEGVTIVHSPAPDSRPEPLAWTATHSWTAYCSDSDESDA